MDWIHDSLSDILQMAIILRDYSSNTTFFDTMLHKLEIMCVETVPFT